MLLLKQAVTRERGGLFRAKCYNQQNIQPLLDTLAAMFLVRQVEGERAYAE